MPFEVAYGGHVLTGARDVCGACGMTGPEQAASGAPCPGTFLERFETAFAEATKQFVRGATGDKRESTPARPTFVKPRPGVYVDLLHVDQATNYAKAMGMTFGDLADQDLADQIAEQPAWKCERCGKFTSVAPNPEHACEDCAFDARVASYVAGRRLDVRRESTPAETALIFCALPWCGREHPVRILEHRGNVTLYDSADLYCSDRCREYDARRLAVVARHEVFTRPIAYTRFGVRADCQWMKDEYAWAESKRDEELAPIERQFRALGERGR